MFKACDIHKTYDHTAHNLHVLKGITFKVAAGEVVAIIGPSGAGKSTLLHILGGLDRPDQGQVLLDGEDLYRLSENRRAQIRNKKLGFIFQFYHLLPEFTALENVILPALVCRDRGRFKDHKARGQELLAEVGLAERESHKPHQLSGGEQQRVAIARALMNQPQILFCDEPTGNLDSQRGRDIIDLLLQLNERNRQTVVIVTHEESIAEKCRRTLHMKDGCLTELEPILKKVRSR